MDRKKLITDHPTKFMPEKVYHTTIKITEDVIDRNGHVNNVVYVEWMQDLAVGHAATWNIDKLMEEQGTSWFARKHGIEYLRPIHLGDVIEARTWIASAERVKSLRRYEFLRDGEKVAQGETEWVYVDIKTGRPRRIPEEMGRFVLDDDDSQ